MKLRNIEILENDSNKKGDLFGRLMGDLFHALGYDQPRINRVNPGREIDLTSLHRTENRIAIAECKAHSEKIGGDDINKFVGALDAEKKKLKKDKQGKKTSVVGYFVSLSGFRESAIEQENELDNKRVVLIRPQKIVEELEKGRILVSIEQAIASIEVDTSSMQVLPYADLLAHQKGWVWAIYFSDCGNQYPTHLALVHAEGKSLIRNLAEEIIALDATANHLFKGLTLLQAQVTLGSKTTIDLEQTKNLYYKFLENELGEIQFEGLPTDKESGAVKVQLENIFVPLNLTKTERSRPIRKDEFEADLFEEMNRQGIGEILSNNSRIAVLAKPGSGKSTLIKRIAIAYAFPERRKLIADKLPERPWFPIFLRCRELDEKVALSITQIIEDIPNRAEISSCASPFKALISQALQNGNAILLIDGLDEIAEDKNRIAFVNQLRTFLATYPTISIIVTSRETGFRAVAGALATYCESYAVSNLSNSEIGDLCEKWHRAIIDHSENTKKEAHRLIELILRDERIRGLAGNPLLLTTLLFVKRWAGYLPTKRSVLYQEMIKLLLVTWNVEGHEMLDIEEAEPQLAFVAYWMTKNGQQTITSDDLSGCLIEARRQLPEILGYTKVSPSEFIRRVESRSSLLILSGHKRMESGALVAVYEFLHLSFQEYLTAKALVKRFVPREDTEKKVVEIIRPYLDEENWKEVIPLAAVLLERNTKELMEFLVAESKLVASKGKTHADGKLAPSLLGSCLANEVQINPELLDTAIEWYSKSKYSVRDSGIGEIILKSKFGPAFRKQVRSCFFAKFDDAYVSPLGSTLGSIFLTDLGLNDDEAVYSEIIAGLLSTEKEEQCIAILALMQFAFKYGRTRSGPPVSNQKTVKVCELLLVALKTNNAHLKFSVGWCVAWMGQANMISEELMVEFIPIFVKNWIASKEKSLKRMSAWALASNVRPSFPPDKIERIRGVKTSIKEIYKNQDNEFDRIAAIYIGYIIGVSFEHSEVSEALQLFQRRRIYAPSANIWQFARLLGVNLNSKGSTGAQTIIASST